MTAVAHLLFIIIQFSNICFFYKKPKIRKSKNWNLNSS